MIFLNATNKITVMAADRKCIVPGARMVRAKADRPAQTEEIEIAPAMIEAVAQCLLDSGQLSHEMPEVAAVLAGECLQLALQASSPRPSTKTLELRRSQPQSAIYNELPWDVALEKARAFFAASKGVHLPTDLADAIGTSVSQAIDLCEALEAEGAIAVKEESKQG